MAKTEDPNDARGLTKPWCYHINQFEELREIILDVVDYGERLGISPTYGDHEDSPGQLELNFLFDRAVRTADSLSTYRQICAAVARKHGVIASFMPKPFTGVSANGAHHHFTLVDENGNNVFYDPDGPAKLSEIGLQFMGGIPRVPEHLGEALQALAEDEVVRSALPGRLYDVYMHYKRDEWEQFLAAVTDWEREKYLDVLP